MPEERTTKPVRPHPHPWSLQIAVVAGIPIRLHFTFFLGLIYFGYMGSGGHGFNWTTVALVIALFACVALHELGHSLVALHYKIPVADITLYPIGGVASIEKRPVPVQEFWIAVAGPAVNVVIAAVLWIVAGQGRSIPAFLTVHPAIGWIFGMNVMLVLFNAIPAFPMDGGRVLRSILAMNMPAERATSIAAGIGQLIAILFGIVALFFHGGLVLMFIAFFIYVGAGQEAAAYRQAAMMEGISAGQAMMTDVRTLSVGDTLKDAADVLLSTSQHDFPVLHGDVVQGVLTRNGLLRGLAEQGPTGYVAGVMEREFASVSPDDELSTALLQMEEDQAPVVVLDPKQGGKLLGMISGENVAEFFAIRRIDAARNGLAT